MADLNKTIDGLERLRFFNQRAGRELWKDKPHDVQEQDIASADMVYADAIELLKSQQAEMAKQMDNLKPCPFCGGEVEIESYVSNDPVTFADGGFRIKCKECRIGFSKSTRCLPGNDNEADEKVKQELAERWNTRNGGDGNG